MNMLPPLSLEVIPVNLVILVNLGILVNLVILIDKPARLIIRLLFGFVSDSVVQAKKKKKTNTETAILSRF